MKAELEVALSNLEKTIPENLDKLFSISAVGAQPSRTKLRDKAWVKERILHRKLVEQALAKLESKIRDGRVSDNQTPIIPLWEGEFCDSVWTF